jgi:hypothetical protein
VLPERRRGGSEQPPGYPPKWIDPEQKPRYNYLHNQDPPP